MLFYKSILFWCILGIFLTSSYAYKILVICTLPSMSHYILTRGVVDILVDKGHDVYFISPFGAIKPEFKDLNVPGLMYIRDEHITGFNVRNVSGLEGFRKMQEMQAKFIKPVFEDIEIQKFISDKSQKFDAVIFEYGMNEMIMGFGVKYNCPIIVLSSISPPTNLATMTNNPLSPATVPHFFTPFTENMNLKQRIINLGVTIIQELIVSLFLDPIQSELYQNYFPEESEKVPFDQLKKSISTLLVNTHPSIGISRPFLPNVVEVGGFHVKDSESLPEDLQNILDEAKNGVIYFSMGSSLKSSQMNPELKAILLKSFSKLKQSVLWKYEDPLQNIPENLYIRQWMPQNDILAHPNVKLFITHGGLLSYTEAVHFGVPLIVIPIFGDQGHNAKVIEENGNGLILEFENITDVSFDWALKEALENSRYEENAKKLKQVYHDRPLKPKDLLAFHVEHTIRTKGALHLSPPQLSRCSQLLLDVIAIILLPLGCISIIFSYVIFKCCCKKKQQSCKKQQKKKN